MIVKNSEVRKKPLITIWAEFSEDAVTGDIKWTITPGVNIFNLMGILDTVKQDLLDHLNKKRFDE